MVCLPLSTALNLPPHRTLSPGCSRNKAIAKTNLRFLVQGGSCGVLGQQPLTPRLVLSVENQAANKAPFSGTLLKAEAALPGRQQGSGQGRHPVRGWAFPHSRWHTERTVVVICCYSVYLGVRWGPRSKANPLLALRGLAKPALSSKQLEENSPTWPQAGLTQPIVTNKPLAPFVVMSSLG